MIDLSGYQKNLAVNLTNKTRLFRAKIYLLHRFDNSLSSLSKESIW